MARYIPIGTPINRGELEGLRLLRDRLPAHYTLLGNFELQIAQRRNTIEFDAIILGDDAVYVVEIKGWSGSIQGDMRRWQLPWGRVESPFIRNESRAKALRSFLSQMIPDLPASLCCESVVYLPSSKASVTLDDPRAHRLLLRDQEHTFFTSREAAHHTRMTPELRSRIEQLLLPLSSAKQRSHHIPNYIIREDISQSQLPYHEYIAQHVVLRSRGQVRIKSYTVDALLAPERKEDTYASTLSEIEALNILEPTPYAARAYELIRDEEDDLVFHVVSEWVSSRTLHDTFKQSSTPILELAPPQRHERWALAAHMVRAISELHALGVTHRNLTPRAFALTSKNSSQQVPFKLIDFDFARIGRFNGHEEARRRIVSMGYGAPELWMGLAHPHDHRVDIYALGAILFELLAGDALYKPKIHDLLRHDEIWELRRDLLPDEASRQLIGHMLAYAPEDRLEHLDQALSFFLARARMFKPPPPQHTAHPA